MSTVRVSGAKPKLERAYLTLLAPTPAGTGGAPLETLQFKFNPKTYSIDKSANWSRSAVAGAQAGPLSFHGADPKSLSLEIFLDESDSNSRNLLKDIDLLFKCCTPTDESLSAGPASPPFVRFGWGEVVSFTAIVKSVSVKYTMFRPDGVPFRATATLKLEEVFQPASAQNPTSGGTATRRTHVVMEGDTLQSIAYREYRDPTRWRVIAEANRITDPMRITPGTRLLVPSPAELDPVRR